MLLAIDSGNTNIVFALFDGEQVRGEWRSSTDTNRTADEFGVWLTQLMAMEGLNRHDVDACIIAAVAAHKYYEGSLIVIDFGTATTFDVVDGNGTYCGGAIAPGINLSLEALHMAAAKLPRVAIGRPRTVIGKATVPAMRSGIFWGYCGLIEGLVTRIKKEFGAPMTVLATGGLAPLFMEAIDVIQHLDPDLTLRGLLAIHRLNAKQ